MTFLANFAYNWYSRFKGDFEGMKGYI